MSDYGTPRSQSKELDRPGRSRSRPRSQSGRTRSRSGSRGQSRSQSPSESQSYSHTGSQYTYDTYDSRYSRSYSRSPSRSVSRTPSPSSRSSRARSPRRSRSSGRSPSHQSRSLSRNTSLSPSRSRGGGYGSTVGETDGYVSTASDFRSRTTDYESVSAYSEAVPSTPMSSSRARTGATARGSLRDLLSPHAVLTSTELPSFTVVARVRGSVGEMPRGAGLVAGPEGRSVRLAQYKSRAAQTFIYDRVYSADASQANVYSGHVSLLLSNFMAFSNSSLFLHGQSGSGKTHTLMGDLDNRGHFGIVPRLIEDMFFQFNYKHNASFRLCVTYYQIEASQLRDLLPDRKEQQRPLEVTATKEGGYRVAGLNKFTVRSHPELLKLVRYGNKKRQRLIRSQKESSVAAHSVLTFMLEETAVSSGGNKKVIASSRFNLVELADNSRRRRGKEEDDVDDGIDSLGFCFQALTQPNHSQVVPFRDSTLTQLVMEPGCMRTPAKTVFLVCLHPSVKHYWASYHSLRFATKAFNTTHPTNLPRYSLQTDPVMSPSSPQPTPLPDQSLLTPNSVHRFPTSPPTDTLLTSGGWGLAKSPFPAPLSSIKPDLPVGSVPTAGTSYRFYRWRILATAGGDSSTMVQVSMVQFFGAGGRQLFPISVANPGRVAPTTSSFPDDNGPDRLLDNDLQTTWIDHRKASDIIFDFGEVVAMSDYKWWTAADHPEADPTAWVLEGSNDVSAGTWVVLDSQDETLVDMVAPSRRRRRSSIASFTLEPDTLLPVPAEAPAKAPPAPPLSQQQALRDKHGRGEPVYRWYRWTITSGMKPSGSIQVSKVEFSSHGVPVAPVSVTNPGRVAPQLPGPSHDPECLLDGSLETKWVDSRDSSVLVFDFGPTLTQPVTAFEWFTASDFRGSDPYTWTMEGSEDGIQWKFVQVRNPIADRGVASGVLQFSLPELQRHWSDDQLLRSPAGLDVEALKMMDAHAEVGKLQALNQQLCLQVSRFQTGGSVDDQTLSKFRQVLAGGGPVERQLLAEFEAMFVGWGAAHARIRTLEKDNEMLRRQLSEGGNPEWLQQELPPLQAELKQGRAQNTPSRGGPPGGGSQSNSAQIRQLQQQLAQATEQAARAAAEREALKTELEALKLSPAERASPLHHVTLLKQGNQLLRDELQALAKELSALQQKPPDQTVIDLTKQVDELQHALEVTRSSKVPSSASQQPSTVASIEPELVEILSSLVEEYSTILQADEQASDDEVDLTTVPRHVELMISCSRLPEGGQINPSHCVKCSLRKAPGEAPELVASTEIQEGVNPTFQDALKLVLDGEVDPEDLARWEWTLSIMTCMAGRTAARVGAVTVTLPDILGKRARSPEGFKLAVVGVASGAGDGEIVIQTLVPSTEPDKAGASRSLASQLDKLGKLNSSLAQELVEVRDTLKRDQDERELLLMDRSDLTVEVERLQAVVEEQEAMLAEANEGRVDTEKYQQIQQELEMKLASLRTAVSELQRRLEAGQSERESLLQEVKLGREEQRRVEGELGELADSHSALQRENEQLMQEYQEYVDSQEEAVRQLESKHQLELQEWREREEGKARLDSDLERLRESRARVEREYEECKRELLEAAEACEKWEQQSGAAHEGLAAMEREYEVLNQQFDELTREHAELRARSAAEIQSLTEANETIRKEKEEATGELGRVKKKNQQLQERRRSLKSTTEELNGHLELQRDELDALRVEVERLKRENEQLQKQQQQAMQSEATRERGEKGEGGAGNGSGGEAEAKEQIALLRSANQELQQRVDELEEERSQKLDDSDPLWARLEKERADREALEGEVAELMRTIQTIERAKEAEKKEDAPSKGEEGDQEEEEEEEDEMGGLLNELERVQAERRQLDQVAVALEAEVEMLRAQNQQLQAQQAAAGHAGSLKLSHEQMLAVQAELVGLEQDLRRRQELDRGIEGQLAQLAEVSGLGSFALASVGPDGDEGAGSEGQMLLRELALLSEDGEGQKDRDDNATDATAARDTGADERLAEITALESELQRTRSQLAAVQKAHDRQREQLQSLQSRVIVASEESRSRLKEAREGLLAEMRANINNVNSLQSQLAALSGAKETEIAALRLELVALKKASETHTQRSVSGDSPEKAGGDRTSAVRNGSNGGEVHSDGAGEGGDSSVTSNGLMEQLIHMSEGQEEVDL